MSTKTLTAANALSRVDSGDVVTFGGQSFADGTCVVGGTETVGSLAVVGGDVVVEVAAGEAVMVVF